jgi:hypothetical protein
MVMANVINVKIIIISVSVNQWLINVKIISKMSGVNGNNNVTNINGVIININNQWRSMS